MIDASVENLMDRQATHRFTTSAWKSLRLSHNHVDNCFAVTHIFTRQITTNSICQKLKSYNFGTNPKIKNVLSCFNKGLDNLSSKVEIENRKGIFYSLWNDIN